LPPPAIRANDVLCQQVVQSAVCSVFERQHEPPTAATATAAHRHLRTCLRPGSAPPPLVMTSVKAAAAAAAAAGERLALSAARRRPGGRPAAAQPGRPLRRIAGPTCPYETSKTMMPRAARPASCISENLIHCRRAFVLSGASRASNSGSPLVYASLRPRGGLRRRRRYPLHHRRRTYLILNLARNHQRP